MSLASFFGGARAGTKDTASALDVVTYIASLASEPRAIDPLLDPMREIGSRTEPGKPLSDADQTALAEVCRRIQLYLVQQDPLRTFDQASLREKIIHKFPRHDPQERTFWSKLI
jgi:hypothetical protein